MDITTVPIDFAAFGIGQSTGDRAIGLHASDLYNDFYKDKEPGRYGRPGLPPPVLLETGLIFESILEEGLARKYAADKREDIIRPGEFTFSDQFDGRPLVVHYNPDLFIFNGVLRIGEIKATWLSSKIPHEWTDTPELQEDHKEDIADAIMVHPKLEKYFTQLKFYCYMQKTLYGRFYLCFVAGNYDRPFKTQLINVDVEFTQDEVEQEYAMLCWHGLSKGLF